MKAKQLAEILLQNPNAEVITQMYMGDDFFVPIDHAELHKKGTTIQNPVRSASGAITNNGKCNVDVIYIGRTERC